MSKLDKRLDALERARQPVEKSILIMTDSELCDAIRKHDIRCKDMTDDEIGDFVDKHYPLIMKTGMSLDDL